MCSAFFSMRVKSLFLKRESQRRRPEASGTKIRVKGNPGTSRRRENHAEQAGSRISNLPSPSADRRARTPKGSVSIGREVCPIGAPKTMGIS